MPQYIFTWYATRVMGSALCGCADSCDRYGLAAATSIMFWMVAKKPPSDVAKRVRTSRSW